MRLIDADEAKAMVKPYETSDEEWMCTGGTAIRLIHKVIDNAPTVDAVPVVRCMDCKYSVNAKWNKKGYRICPASHMEITDNDFCSYGERKGQFADPGKLEEEHNAAKETT